MSTNPIQTHFNNMPEADRLQAARELLKTVTSPALHHEKMQLGNEICRSADDMEREWRNQQ